MKKLLLTLLILTMFIPVVLSAAEITSFRSPYGKHIYVGDYYYTVQKALGNPSDKLHTEIYYGGNFIWAYDHKHSGYVYYLTFVDGKLIRIEYDRRR